MIKYTENQNETQSVPSTYAQNGNKNPSFMHLPLNILVLIFHQLQKQDLLKLALCSKMLRTIMKTNYFGTLSGILNTFIANPYDSEKFFSSPLFELFQPTISNPIESHRNANELAALVITNNSLVKNARFSAKTVLEIMASQHPLVVHQFVRYFQNSLSYLELSKKFQTSLSNLTAEEIFCFALTTRDVKKLDCQVLKDAKEDFEQTNPSEKIKTLITTQLEALNALASQEKKLNGKDWRGINLSGADLANANLTNANLTGAILNNADLTGAKLYSVNLTNATLYFANLTDARLLFADLTRAYLEGANLTEANLMNVILSESTNFNLCQFFSRNLLLYSNNLKEYLHMLWGNKNATESIKIKVYQQPLLNDLCQKIESFTGNKDQLSLLIENLTQQEKRPIFSEHQNKLFTPFTFFKPTNAVITIQDLIEKVKRKQSQQQTQTTNTSNMTATL